MHQDPLSQERAINLSILANGTTRQMTLPTENGHAAPPVESRKSYESVNAYCVSEPGEFPRVESNQAAISTPPLVVPAQTSSKTGTALIAVALII